MSIMWGRKQSVGPKADRAPDKRQVVSPSRRWCRPLIFVSPLLVAFAAVAAYFLYRHHPERSTGSGPESERKGYYANIA